MFALIASHRGAFWASQIYQLQLTRDHIIHIIVVNDLKSYSENSMGSRASVVQEMRGDYFVFNASVEQVQQLLFLLTLKNKEILDLELIFFRPSNS